ncbi:dephospho-CoA kinase [Litoribacillus peritrichatus]|uniref:Dephospho-CoA kinase n=1 Tax=Litoribacillus peritrichatus TaxID=718191 RepID=A0ABP7M0G7_9GAMM
MQVIGLTGGIGSGKSTVSKAFAALGIHVVDADQKARDVVQQGKPALSQIADHFGQSILQGDGNLNRAKLRTIIFNAPKEKDWLEHLLHPLIRKDIEQDLLSASSPYAILESPLLFETDQHEMTDKTLLVDVPVDVQVARGCIRDNNSEEQIRKIIASQMPREEKQLKADFILDNNEDISTLSDKVDKLHQQFLKLSAC